MEMGWRPRGATAPAAHSRAPLWNLTAALTQRIHTYTNIAYANRIYKQ